LMMVNKVAVCSLRSDAAAIKYTTIPSIPK
jgi:hypothetical protein